MSFATDAAAIKLVLTGLGYKELENNLDLINEMPSKLINKGFTLKAKGVESKHLTNKKQLNSVITDLVISYTIKNNAGFDASVDLFKTAINALSDYHYGFSNNPTIERHPSNTNYCFGKASIYVGVEGC
jgi:hypothetical protein